MWRATAPYRVRIALALKGLAFDYAPVNLTAGEQAQAPYTAVNRQGLVPSLSIDGRVLTQSLAIIEWLEEAYPDPPLLPRDPFDRAAVRSMAAIVACDIHPLNNLRVLRALGELGAPLGSPAQQAWGRRWIEAGFAALEPMVAELGRGFAFGEAPGMADCFIVPQVWACSRFAVDLAPYPALAGVAERVATHPAFVAAHPERQPDAA
jgi:maleylacetoacetate isomerase